METASGLVQGLRLGAVTVWLGLPYAEPPVGRLRFRSPQPVKSWTGIRSARRYAGAGMQTGPLGASAKQLGSNRGEDCLYLNVFAPESASTDGRARPVLVWIHGGAFRSGSGAVYDGAPLAELGDVVVVTINYRLGVFGFVDFSSALDVEMPSNLGLRDQIAALTWVRDNIAAFGGDPDHVTVAGESAGSTSVSLLSCAPAARGLFRAAVMESGSYNLIHGPEVSQEIARGYARGLGIGPGDVDRLWDVSTEQLFATQRAVDRANPGTLPAAPWFDDDVVPGSLEAAQAAVRPDLPLLAGHNHDEITLFQRLPEDVLPTRRADLVARLRAAWGWTAAETVLSHYPDSSAGTRALGTDLNFALPTQHFAERHAAAGGPTFYYRFDAAVPVLGATHASELAYLWDWSGLPALALRGRRTAAKAALAHRMREHWLAFARDGAPGPDWPAFELGDRAVRIFDPAGDWTEHDPSRARRLAWAGRDVLPRS